MASKFLEDPDVQLMLRVKGGDGAAFDALVSRYAPILVNFAFKFVGSRATAEDLAQETLLKAWGAASRYVPRARFQTWLLTIASNLCLNAKRWEKMHGHHSIDTPLEAGEGRTFADDLPDDRAEAPAAPLERDELHHRVRDAVGRLPENQRVALILARYHEMPYSEIGEVLGLTVMAVKSLLNRARENLHDRLARELKDFAVATNKRSES